jgi:predicted transcriptional regulator
MSSPLITVDRGTAVGNVVETMLSKNISSIPVIDECSVVGVVTRAALVNAL